MHPALRIPARTTPRPAQCRAWALALGFVAALLATPAGAVEIARLAFARAEGAGWSARGIELQFALGSQRLDVAVREARVPGLGTLRDVRIACPSFAVRGGIYRCDDAEISGAFGPAGTQRFRTAFEYHSGTGAIRLDARELRLAGGPAEFAGALDDAGWRVRATTRGTDLASAAALAKPYAALPDGYTVEGRADLSLDAAGAGTRVRDARVNVALAALTLANAGGTVATDRLGGTLDATLAAADDGWRFETTFASTGGQGYVDPVFVDFAKLPLHLEARGTLPASGPLRIERFAARQPDALALSGSAEIDPAADVPLRAATVNVEALTFPGAGAYVAPFLATTEFRNATARGGLHGTVTIANGLPAALDVTIDGIDADDPDGALAFTALAGRVRWYDDSTKTVVPNDGEPDDAYVSTLGWRSGRLYGIALGESRVKLTASGRSFRLLEPVFVPVFDGGLRIERLRMRHIGEPEMWLRLDARVEPISLALISKALDWPEFGGTVSGTIPAASLERGVLTFGGNLEASVFGGRVVVGDVRLEDPLGRFPRLLANASVENVDLQQVTGTFSFGEITGRLSGEVNGLELFGWQPVRFDARFATPDGDRSRRRISQRAVKNLSSIGGGGSGVTAALQSGALRFFETFRYDRLGLACRLENDVCRMSGVGPARNGGYYIVRGSGVPRIDIIGRGDRVAWSRLVQQLVAATEGGVEVR